jgi:hypothetical protein
MICCCSRFFICCCCLTLPSLYRHTDGSFRTSEVGGSWSSGPMTPYEVICPVGSHIITFNGRRLGDINDAVGPFTCTNSQILPLIGNITGGTVWTHTAGTAGFTAVSIRAGTLINRITLMGSFGSASFGGTGGEQKATQQCPPGTVMIGAFGKRSTVNPVTIGLICRAPYAGTWGFYSVSVGLYLVPVPCMHVSLW